jgi:membrane protein DedA with SNARE-associated domain
MAVASAVWYGVISYLAWRAGSNWDEVTAMIARSGRVLTVAACVLVLIGALFWLSHRRRRQAAS